jgi:hypothetical protein
MVSAITTVSRQYRMVAKGTNGTFVLDFGANNANYQRDRRMGNRAKRRDLSLQVRCTYQSRILALCGGKDRYRDGHSKSAA